MPSVITCLFSHKCSDDTHRLGQLLKRLLADAAVDLLIDPFRIGDDADTRMDSFHFDACLFLCSPDSLASRACRRELRTARRRSVPVLIALFAGTVPIKLKKRIYWTIPRAESPEIVIGVDGLAQAIHTRVELHRNLNTLAADCPPDEAQSVAERIALETDPSLVAEVVSVLAMKYLDVKDPTTRFWIALALGAAGTPRAARLLDQLPSHDHPYVREGIRQAQEMIILGR